MTETASAARASLPLAAVLTGFAVAWAAPSRTVALAVIAVGLAAMNGYSKAYSP